MMKNEYIPQIIEIRALTMSMIEIASEGMLKSESESLLLIYGEILDCAHTIQRTLDYVTENF
jgi:hypothetical protein